MISTAFNRAEENDMRRDSTPLRRCSILVLALTVTPSIAAAAESVSYHLTYDLREPSLVAVQINLPQSTSGERVFVMPRAIPRCFAFDTFETSLKKDHAVKFIESPLCVKGLKLKGEVPVGDSAGGSR